MKTGASASQQCVVEIEKMKKIIAIDEQNDCIREESFGCLSTDGSSPKHNNRVCEIENIQFCEDDSKTKTIKIRQATKDGFIDCEIPGIADLNYVSSKTRRGRVVRGGADLSNIMCGEYP